MKKGENCILDCSIIAVDMGTFDCPAMCNVLCNSSIKESFTFKLSNLYPGLTIEERALSAKYPLKMLKAYKLSLKAERLCSKLFINKGTNDASDACRHFIWSALLYKEFGIDFSSQILYSHEQDPMQNKNERAMDIANNRLGQVVAEQLIQKNRFSDKELLKLFRQKLKNRRFIILKESSGVKK